MRILIEQLIKEHQTLGFWLIFVLLEIILFYYVLETKYLSCKYLKDYIKNPTVENDDLRKAYHYNLLSGECFAMCSLSQFLIVILSVFWYVFFIFPVLAVLYLLYIVTRKFFLRLSNLMERLIYRKDLILMLTHPDPSIRMMGEELNKKRKVK